MIKKALLFIFLTIFGLTISSQNAILKGLITDKETKDALIGALVFAEGTDFAVESDIEGNFQLSLPKGQYNIIISYEGYLADTIKNLEVPAGQIIVKNISLKQNVSEIDNVHIDVKIEKNTADQVLIERKNASGTSDGVDQKTLTQSNNPTVSEGLKRVTGASIQDGKFAIIRGMGDRYNAGYINGSPLPSTESDRKAFSFDILPTSLIDNLMILKSGSPDFTGDFGGGVIKVNTKSIPDSFTVNIGGGVQFNSVTTGKSYTAFNGSKTDWLGYDNKLRPRPTDLATTLGSDRPGKELTAYVEDTKKFNNDFALQQLKAPFGSRFNLSIGAPIFKKENFELGAIGAYNYNQTYTRTEKISRFYKADFDNGLMNSDYNDTIGVMTVNNSTLWGIGTKINKNHKIEYKGLNGLSSSISNLSRSGNAGAAEGNTIYPTQYSSIMLYNRLRTHQFLGEHKLLNKRLKLEWNLSNTKISKHIPDYRVTTYTRFTNEDGDTFMTLPASDNFSSGNGRFYGDLLENLNSASLDGTYQLNSDDSSKILSTLKIGGFYQDRDREFESYKYVFKNVKAGDLHPQNPELDFNNESFTKNNTFMYDPTPLPDRKYEASSNLSAFYAMLDQNFAKKLKLTYGLRYEAFKQEVVSGGVASNLNKNVWLPSLNANYKLTPSKSNLRAAAYKSVNRPEFREVAKFAFYDFVQNADFVGNPNLKQADIYNFESRYEFLPSVDQIISVGGFYKIINNPIESRYDASQATFRTYTFANEKRARVYGIELEFKKTFGFLAPKREHNIFNFFYFTSNLSLIASRVEIAPNSSSIEGRPLQGQSPYLLNVALGYDNQNNGTSVTLTANKYGRRLSMVGPTRTDKGQINPNGYNIFENPRTVIDFQISKTFAKKYTLKATFGDILHQDLVFYNDVDKDNKFKEDKDNIISKSKIGYTFTLAASANF